MIAGIYALASFGDQPVDQADFASLTIDRPHTLQFGSNVADHGIVPEPFRSDGRITLFLGEPDDPQEVAKKIGLSRSPEPAELASRALDRWQDRISLEMPGFWSLVQWDENRKQCTIASSFGLRDPLVVAASGSQFALAPSVSTLTKLSWVARDIDPDSFALAAMRWNTRRDHPDPVIVKNVQRLEPGSVHVFDASGHSKSDRPRPPFSPFQGTFEEAVEQLESVGRVAMRRILDRHDTVAVLLSGGLDSSLVSLFAAQEARAGQKVIAVSSVSLPESNAPDERKYIDLVAQSLGIEVIHATPPDDMEFLQPHEATMMQRESPAIASNHFVYRHLIKIAREAGATACLGGEFGEAHFSRLPNRNPGSGFRAVVKNLLSPGKKSIPNSFLFWPSEEIRARATALEKRPTKAEEMHFFGYGDIYEKAGRLSTQSTNPDIRYYRIFESPELFHLAAGFPDQFSNHGGRSRALARHILGKHLPGMIANRQDKGPISPDFQYRMIGAANAAQNRLTAYRKQGLDRLIDIERIDSALKAIKKGDHKIANGPIRELQTALNAAEFTCWWLSSSDSK